MTKYTINFNDLTEEEKRKLLELFFGKRKEEANKDPLVYINLSLVLR